MFCAGLYGEGGRDACKLSKIQIHLSDTFSKQDYFIGQGDSGGPVVIGEIVQGLVSWGTGKKKWFPLMINECKCCFRLNRMCPAELSGSEYTSCILSRMD